MDVDTAAVDVCDHVNPKHDKYYDEESILMSFVSIENPKPPQPPEEQQSFDDAKSEKQTRTRLSNREKSQLLAD